MNAAPATRTLRILFVANTPRNPLKGASGCDIATIDALREQGHHVDEIWDSDMQPRRIPHGNLHLLLELPSRFSHAVAKKTQNTVYDVIQVNECHAYKAARQHRQARRPGIFVNRSHGWEPSGRRALAKWAAEMDRRSNWKKRASSTLSWIMERHNRLVVKYSDAMVVCSEDDRSSILGNYRADAASILALPPGAPRDFINEPIATHERSAQHLLHVGQFHPAKAPQIIANVASQVLRTDPRAKFTWVCDQRDHVAALSLLAPDVLDRVSMLDWMDRSQLRQVYDRHAIFLFPSYTEGFSLTFLEALARGLCVVATRINGMKEVINDGANGYLFERDDVQGMAEQILKLFQSPQLADLIGAAARQTAELYPWSASALKLESFYLDRLIHKQKWVNYEVTSK